MTTGGRGQRIAAKELADRADVLLRRATLVPVLLLVPVVFLPLRYPPDAFGDRAINVALHVAVAILLFALTRRLGTRMLVAPATVLIFAVHPAHVDAIAVAAARADILATAAALAALLSFTYAGPWPGHERTEAPSIAAQRAGSWLTGAFLLLALGSSPVALSAPALLLALEWLFRPADGSRGRRWWLGRVPAFAPSVVALLVYVVLRIGDLIPTPDLPPPAPGVDGLATALAVLARKVGVLFYPLTLSAEPSAALVGPPTDWLHPLPITGSVVLAILVWVAARPFIGKSRTGFGAQASFATLLFLLPYFTTGGLSVNARFVSSDRCLYFPSVGFCLLLGLAIGAVSAGRLPGTTRRSAAPTSGAHVRLAALALGALVSGFSILTWARCLEWRDHKQDHRTTSRANDIACATRLGSLEDRIAPQTATPEAPARINSGIRETVTPPMA